MKKPLHAALTALSLLLPAATVGAQVPANCQRISGEENAVAPDGYEADGTPVFCAKNTPAYGDAASGYTPAPATPAYGQQGYGQSQPAAGGYGQPQGGYGQPAQGAGGWAGAQGGGQQGAYGAGASGAYGGASGGYGGASGGYGGASGGYGAAPSGGFQGGTFGAKGGAPGATGAGGSANPYASGKTFTKRPKRGANGVAAPATSDPYAGYGNTGGGYGGGTPGGAVGADASGYGSSSTPGYGGNAASGYGSDSSTTGSGAYSETPAASSGPSSSDSWPQQPSGPSSSMEPEPAASAGTWASEPGSAATAPVAGEPQPLRVNPDRLRGAAALPKPLVVPKLDANAALRASGQLPLPDTTVDPASQPAPLKQRAKSLKPLK